MSNNKDICSVCNLKGDMKSRDFTPSELEKMGANGIIDMDDFGSLREIIRLGEYRVNMHCPRDYNCYATLKSNGNGKYCLEE